MKILSISEDGFSRKYGNGYVTHYDGFTITTDEGQVLIGIDGSQQCCENAGYTSTLDNVEDFIGADIIKIDIVDIEYNPKELPKNYCVDANTVFVNVHTSKGLFQVTAYNDHNGYYSHHVLVSHHEEVVLSDSI